MANGFSITSKINLVLANLDQTTRKLRDSLENIELKIDADSSRSKRDIDKMTKSTDRLKNSIDRSSSSMYDFGRQTAITLKRFSAYTVATAAMYKLSGALSVGINEAISFQDQMIKIKQVTGESSVVLKELEREVTSLARTWGVSSLSILEGSQILAQAGLSAREVKAAIGALARSELAPTFDNIKATADASVAILRQFGLSADKLEESLSSINTVAAKFAVESADLTKAIQITGGAFAAAGGNIDELNALMTSVRGTTLETASSIATGFRTIFTRMQRSRTQEYLMQMGINLKEFGDEARAAGKEGLFVGAYEAVRRLSAALGELDSADPRFAQVVEELGGFRQISKVIPLIQQFATSENALGFSIRGRTSLMEDAITRQESYMVQLNKIRENFQLFIRELGQSENIKRLISLILTLTDVAISAVRAFRPLIELLPLLFATKAISGTGQFLKGLKSPGNFAYSERMAGGGKIGGSGNKDSELIMAMPGEYVIRKSSVRKYGTSFMAALNNGEIPKYKDGGPIGKTIEAARNTKLSKPSVSIGISVLAIVSALKFLTEDLDELTKTFLGTAIGSSAMLIALKKSNSETGRFKENIAKTSVRLKEASDIEFRARKKLSDARQADYMRGESRFERVIKTEGLISSQSKYLADTESDISLLQGRRFTLDANEENLGVLQNKLADFAPLAKADPKVAARLVKAFNTSLLNTEELAEYTAKSAKLQERYLKLAERHEKNPTSATTFGLRSVAADMVRLPEVFIGRAIRRTYKEQDDVENEIARKEGIRLVQQESLEEYQSYNRSARNLSARNRSQFSTREFYDPSRSYNTNLTPQQLASLAPGSVIDVTHTADDVDLAQEELRRAEQRRKAELEMSRRQRKRDSRARNVERVLFTSTAFAPVISAGLRENIARPGIEKAERGEVSKESAKLAITLGGVADSLSGFSNSVVLVTSALKFAGISVTSPIGLAVTAITTIGYSIQSFNKSIEEANTRIDTLDMSRVGEKLTEALSSFTSDRAGVGSVASQINSSLEVLSRSIASESRDEVRDTALASLDTQVSFLIEFANQVASTSRTMEDFNALVSTNTQRVIADITGKTLPEYRRRIEESIKVQNEYRKTSEAGVKANRELELGLLSQRALSSAATSAANSLNFLSNGASQVFSGDGINFSSRIDGIFDSIKGGVSTDDDLGRLSDFASNFGSAADNLAQNSIDAANAISLLPSILLGVRSKDPLGGTGNFMTRLEQSLSDNDIPRTITNIILAKANEIIGPEGKEGELISRLRTNFLETLDQFTSSLSDQDRGIFQELESATIANLTKFSEGLDTANAALENIANRSLARFDRASSYQGLEAQVFNRPLNSIAAQEDINRDRLNQITGGRTADELLGILSGSQAREAELRNQYAGTSDLEEQKRLVTLIKREDQARREAIRGLDALADVSNKVSIAQDRLSQLSSQRSGLRSFALNTLTMSPADIQRQQRTLQMSRFALGQAPGTDLRSLLGDAALKDVVDFLSSLGDTVLPGLGGVSGNQALDRILRSQLSSSGIDPRGIVDPSANELAVLKEIKDAIEAANDIDTKRNELESQNRNEFITNLDNNFSTFITNLGTQIDRIFDAERENRIKTAESELDTVRRQGQVATSLKLAGIDPFSAIRNVDPLNSLVEREREFSTRDNIMASLGSLSRDEIRDAGSRILKRGDRVTGDNIVREILERFKGNEAEYEEAQKLYREGVFRNAASSYETMIDPRAGVTDNSGVLKNSFESISIERRKALEEERRKLESERKVLENRVGGSAQARFLQRKDVQEDLSVFRGPDGVTTANSVDSIRSREEILEEQIKALKRNTGGIVPGTGSTDSVSARLTPGEFVVNKNAVRRYGVGLFEALNDQKITSGGSGSNHDFMAGFNSAISRLSNVADKLTKSFSSIPTEISLNANMRIEVIHNGAQVLAQLEPAMRQIAISTTTRAINQFVIQKFPEVGEVDLHA